MYLSENIKENNSSSAQVEENPDTGLQIVRLLRWSGSLLVILSAIGFMLQSHADLLPSYRYWVGLAIVLALCAGGLACNYWLNERIGARLFFALGSAFLPVQVSQVGAMLYVCVLGVQAPKPEYAWLQYGEVHPALIGVDFVLTAALLLAVSYAGFSMLAKRQVNLLLKLALLGNACLLLPVREGLGLAALMALMFVGLLMAERQFQRDGALELLEGKTARAIAGLPLMILIGRSFFYPASYSVAMVLGVIVFYVGIIEIKRYTRNELFLSVGQGLGTFSAMSLWLSTLDQFAGPYPDIYWVMSPLALILIAMSTLVTYHDRTYRKLGALLATGLAFSALWDDHSFAPLLALATGLVLSVISGLKYREKLPFFLGQLCIVGGLFSYGRYIMNAYSHAPWLFSIGLGVLVLLMASVLEKKHQRIVNTVGHYWNELKAWD